MPYLESLSTAELVELAGRNGLDIPPNFERVFVIGELLELGLANARWDERLREVGDEAAWGDPSGEGTIEPREIVDVAELPEQYGSSYVDVLIRDPLWVFAFWEIRKQGREPQDDEAGYCLRIVPLRGDDLLADIAASFTVAVGAKDTSLYIGIPDEDGRCFRIELCVKQGDGQAVLAASHPFRLPRPVAPPDGDPRAVYGNPLAELSGVRCFPLVRSVDRLHRNKGR